MPSLAQVGTKETEALLLIPDKDFLKAKNLTSATYLSLSQVILVMFCHIFESFHKKIINLSKLLLFSIHRIILANAKTIENESCVKLE
jgi:hypothetical protein